ncbi:MAG: hypothetical protein M3337_04615 [Actinomycetota bacterium]|nr:hypothetical protein [Actinomycetota bacterium]
MSGRKHATYRLWPPERPLTYRVFVVRDPVSWYRSYWAYARAATERASAWPIWEAGDKRHPTYRLDVTGGARTFERFVRKVLKEFPHGYVRAMYCDFLNGTTHALRAERLYDDLEWLLGEVGYKNPSVIRKWPRANETAGRFKDQATLPADLEAELRETDNLEGLLIPFVPSKPPS